MKTTDSPDYAEVQAIIWDHMQMLINQLLEEDDRRAHIASHSDTGE